MEATIAGNKILKVYSGKPGCGCGCNGEYFKSGPMLNRVTNRIKEGANKGLNVQIQKVKGKGIIFSLETDKRYSWAYTYKD